MNMNLEALASKLKPYISLEEIKAQDEQTYMEMYEQNVLFVEWADIHRKRVLDIGAYMGFFSMLTVGMEARQVVSVESHPANFKKLQANALRFDQITAIHAAVFDGWQTYVSTIEDLGIAKVVPGSENPVTAIALEDLLPLFPKDDDDLVLKLDTEGAEYDILLNASGRDIRRFSTIFLETHQTPHLKQRPGRKAEFLRGYLDMLGFKVDKERFVYNWQEDGKGGYDWYDRIENQESIKLKRIGLGTHWA